MAPSRTPSPSKAARRPSNPGLDLDTDLRSSTTRQLQATDSNDAGPSGSRLHSGDLLRPNPSTVASSAELERHPLPISAQFASVRRSVDQPLLRKSGYRAAGMASSPDLSAHSSAAFSSEATRDTPARPVTRYELPSPQAPSSSSSRRSVLPKAPPESPSKLRVGRNPLLKSSSTPSSDRQEFPSTIMSSSPSRAAPLVASTSYATMSEEKRSGVGSRSSLEQARGKLLTKGEDNDSPKSTFQNTMRKTSRFFRKFSTSRSSGSATDKGSVPPPVPVIPTSYSIERVAPDDRPISPPSSSARNRKGSLDSGLGSPQSRASVLPTAPTDESPTSLSSAEARRRSSSMSASAANSSSPRTARPTSKMSEDDRLRTELRRWKVDSDGVIDPTGNKSPDSNKSTRNSPSLPTLPSQTSPSVVLRPDRSISAPERSQFSSLPDSPKSLPLLHPVELEAPSIDSPVNAMGTPSIRLVTPSVFVNHAMNDDEPSNGEGNSPAVDGLGLSLETIEEATHSRESSLAPPDPSSSTLSLDNFGATGLPPSFVSLSADSSPVLSSRKAMPRQSVVGYPSGRSPTFLESSQLSIPPDSPLVSETFEERAKGFAQRCWDEDETFLEPRKIAEWLGSTGRLNAAALVAYIDKFDFGGLRLDLAFRRLCDKLYLKAETQQVDRILEQFSRRFWENNPKTIFGSADVVQVVSYSLLLLNTDLHVVETSTRMQRSQFVKNTLYTIHAHTNPSAASTSGPLFGPGSGNDIGREASASMRSLDRFRDNSNSSGAYTRTGAIQNWMNTPPATLNGSPARSILGSSDPSPQRPPIRSSSTGTVASVTQARLADLELETMLKDMYNAIKAQPVFQPLNSLTLPEARSSLSLSAGGSPYNTWNGVNRSASRRSATSTVSTSSAFKRSSIRGFGSFLGTSSLELPRPSSPTLSSSTSFSDENPTTAYGASSQHFSSLGFANSLSHTIIREQQEDDTMSDGGESTTEEELALSGAPWAKEGLIQRKHYWEATGKRSKDKNWLQVFVVIAQGEMRMFRFDGAGTMRGGSAALGGGDWTSNAQDVGSVSLIHSLSSALAAPGYNRDRPHCFVLTLPEGGSYFFQAGTPDLVTEWVSTCNYWSARLSKLPLGGGVSNMEYGWSRVVEQENEMEEMGSIRSGRSGRSVRSGRSSLSKLRYQGSFAGTLPLTFVADRVYVNDWTPPNVPSGASALSEDVQLESLRRHVQVTLAELAVHNTLRAPMLKQFGPRTPNATKALANWERKSSHLLSETVKYKTYVEALQSAVNLRAVKRDEREVCNMLQASDEVEGDERASPMLGSTVELVRAEEKAEGDAMPLHESGKRSRQSVTTTISNDVFFDSDLPSPTSVSSPPPPSIAEDRV